MGKTIKLKCAICNKEFHKPIGEYNRRVRLGKTKFMCSRSCSVAFGNKVTPRGSTTGLAPDNLRDEFTPFRWFTARIRYQEKKHGPSDIDEQFLKQLWEEQQGICSLSGQNLILPKSTSGFSNGKQPYNASIDRINSSRGYVKGNIRFIALIANLAKANWNDSDVIHFCKAVNSTTIWNKISSELR